MQPINDPFPSPPPCFPRSLFTRLSRFTLALSRFQKRLRATTFFVPCRVTSRRHDTALRVSKVNCAPGKPVIASDASSSVNSTLHSREQAELPRLKVKLAILVACNAVFTHLRQRMNIELGIHRRRRDRENVEMFLNLTEAFDGCVYVIKVHVRSQFPTSSLQSCKQAPFFFSKKFISLAESVSSRENESFTFFSIFENFKIWSGDAIGTIVS